MPFNFSGSKGQAYQAKLGVVSDGDIFTVADGAGHTVTSTLSPYTIFSANPVRSATGVWSVETLDSVAFSFDGYAKVLDCHVYTILPSGSYLSTQVLPFTTGSNGQLVLNWVFNVAGTPTDLPSTGHPQFGVYLVYSETTV
jgi:hypothetical protein